MINEAFRAFDRIKRARLTLLRRVEIVGKCWIWRGWSKASMCLHLRVMTYAKRFLLLWK